MIFTKYIFSKRNMPILSYKGILHDLKGAYNFDCDN